MRRPPSIVATLSWFATASPPAARISSTTRSAIDEPPPVPSRAPPRSFTTTAAPARASASACSRPSPPPAPVTIATLPSSRPTLYLLPLRRDAAHPTRARDGRSSLREEDGPELAEGLEAEARVEAVAGDVALDDRELDVARPRREGLSTQIGDTGGGEAAAAELGPGVDALDQPPLRALHVRVADEDHTPGVLHHPRARHPPAHPPAESAHVAAEGVGPLL